MRCVNRCCKRVKVLGT